LKRFSAKNRYQTICQRNAYFFRKARNTNGNFIRRIKEIISLWAKTFQVSPTLILATNLIIDQNGKIIDWNKNIVHTLNKKEQEHDKLTKIKEERPNTILIGDAFEDAEMTDGDKMFYESDL